jgi:hypothetical protein
MKPLPDCCIDAYALGLNDGREEAKEIAEALDRFIVKVEHEFCGCNSCRGIRALAAYKKRIGGE